MTIDLLLSILWNTPGKMSRNPLDECDDEVAQSGASGGIGGSVSTSRKRVTPAPSYARLGRGNSSSSSVGGVAKRQRSIGGGGVLGSLLAKTSSISRSTTKTRVVGKNR
jgi:hypothetical protein